MIEVGDPREARGKALPGWGNRRRRPGRGPRQRLEQADHSEYRRQNMLQVGGGIRTKDLALEYLDAGARAVMIGLKAPRNPLGSAADRLIAALDTNKETIMVEGWTRPPRQASLIGSRN